VTSHAVLWGAPCILWAEPEHVAYAILEAPDLESILRYMEHVVPTSWATRVLPVVSLPGQVTLVRQLLTAPASVFGQPAPVLEAPEAPAPERAPTELESADTGPHDAVADEPVVEAVSARVTRAEGPLPAPVEASPPVSKQSTRPAEPVPAFWPEVNTAGATRIMSAPPVPNVEAPTPPAGTPTPKQVSSITELLEGLEATEAGESERDTPTQGSDTPTEDEPTTVILGKEARRTPTVRLEAVVGPSQGTVFEVGAAGGSIGRLPENLIHLADGRLSRQHARIEFRAGSFWICDLASQNGTLVNGRRLTEPHRMREGDTVEMGTSRFSVSIPSEGE
jgi:hypothetical protein